MKNKTHTSHITPVGGNVFADLGFNADQATPLKAEADSIISKKLALKESLISKNQQNIKKTSLS